MLACAVIACSRTAVELKPQWTAEHQQVAGLSVEDFGEVYERLLAEYLETRAPEEKDFSSELVSPTGVDGVTGGAKAKMF